ncbi:hypothetical protein BJV82DRAFT_573065 [Fennellomyces sp. T-0311]|nr:hypothetical protein BJV82DRAFT_573065 [Fennellomyces sp. T-0311]
MYRLTVLLLIASWLLAAHGVIETTSLPGTPIAPSGTVCIQIICPDPGDGDPTICPERCNGACTTITNACCPQSEVAICAGEPTPGVSTVPTASSPAPTSASSPAESSPAESSSSIQSSPASSASSPPADTTDGSENSEDGTTALALPYYVLPLVLILVTKLLLL